MFHYSTYLPNVQLNPSAKMSPSGVPHDIVQPRILPVPRLEGMVHIIALPLSNDKNVGTVAGLQKHDRVFAEQTRCVGQSPI